MLAIIILRLMLKMRVFLIRNLIFDLGSIRLKPRVEGI
jgi:hypothetical protein